MRYKSPHALGRDGSATSAPRDQDQSEDDEGRRCPDFDGPLREAGPELLADHDRQGVGRHHAERRPDPRPDEAFGGRQGDGGEHRPVTELGEEGGHGGGDDRGARAALRITR